MVWVEVPADVMSRDLNGEAVLLDLRSGRYFGLNATGARVWAGLKDGLERDAIARTLVDEFDVTDERALADVDGFVSVLRERGLVREAS